MANANRRHLCPNCHNSFHYQEKFCGKKVRCKVCSAVFRVTEDLFRGKSEENQKKAGNANSSPPPLKSASTSPPPISPKHLDDPLTVVVRKDSIPQSEEILNSKPNLSPPLPVVVPNSSSQLPGEISHQQVARSKAITKNPAEQFLALNEIEELPLDSVPAGMLRFILEANLDDARHRVQLSSKLKNRQIEQEISSKKVWLGSEKNQLAIQLILRESELKGLALVHVADKTAAKLRFLVDANYPENLTKTASKKIINFYRASVAKIVAGMPTN